LSPVDEAGRLWAHQLQLTIADMVTEVHDTHHPIGAMLYYEDQNPRHCVEQRIFATIVCRSFCVTSNAHCSAIPRARIVLRVVLSVTQTCPCFR
jgi:hypothetical protein